MLRYIPLFTAATLFVLLVFAEFGAPTVELRVKPKKVSHQEGYAFTVGIPSAVPFPYEFRGDGGAGGNVSTLRLFEDSRELGPAHRSHEKIRRFGRGGFQHWQRTLYFSSYDGSDPRNNVHLYTVRGVARVIPSLWACSGVLLFLGWLTSRGSTDSGRLDDLMVNQRGGVSRSTAVLVIAGAIITAFASLCYKWYVGNTDWLGIYGFLPVSDANNYWQCAALLQDGTTNWASYNIADWCGRRIIYPSMLSTLLSVTDWNLWATLLTQGAIVALSIASLSLACYPFTGLAGAVLVYCLLFAFAYQYVFGVLMTEVPGLAFGSCSISLLISGSALRSCPHRFIGLALMSLALVARAGAMVVIPALFLWELWVSRRNHRNLMATAFSTSMALLSGFALQWLLLFLQGQNVSATFGNFSTTLYRLSKGGETWAEAYADHPELFDGKIPESEAFRELYRIALQNIQDHPLALLSTFWREFQHYLPEMAGLGVHGPVGGLVSFLLLCGIYVCVRRWRESWASLLLVVTIPELLIGPLLFADGGERIFAATIGGRAALVSVGIAELIKGFAWPRTLLIWISYPKSRSSISVTRSSSALAGGLGACIVFSTLLPHTHALGFAKQTPLRAPESCESPYVTNMLRLDKDSISFGVVDSDTKSSVMPLRVNAARLRKGLPNDWYADDFRDAEPPFLLIQGIDRSEHAPGVRLSYLVWKGNMPKGGGIVLACADTTEAMDFAGTRYAVIKRLIEL